MEKNDFLKSHGSMCIPEQVEYTGNFLNEYTERVRDEVMEKGKPRHKMVYKTVKPGDKFKGIKASDFDLEILIALGALDGVKDCQLSMNSMEATDNLVSNASNLVSAAESEQTSNEGGNE